jgi:hypothetical protein
VDIESDECRRGLWTLDARTGEERLVIEAERIRLLAFVGLHTISPKGDEVVFAAGPDEETSVHVLRLADRSVRQVIAEGGPDAVGSVRWRGDGLLVLKGRRKVEGEWGNIAVWTMRSDGSDLACVWEQESDDSDHAVSPSGRWLLHDSGENEDGEAMTIVNLVNGECRTMALRGLYTLDRVAWLADDRGFACGVGPVKSGDVVLIDCVTGSEEGRVTGIAQPRYSFALSPMGRFVACFIRSGRMRRLRIVELTTGRSVTLRQPYRWGYLDGDMSFSPDERFLAVRRAVFGPPYLRAMIQIIDLRSW